MGILFISFPKNKSTEIYLCAVGTVISVLGIGHQESVISSLSLLFRGSIEGYQFSVPREILVHPANSEQSLARSCVEDTLPERLDASSAALRDVPYPRNFVMISFITVTPLPLYPCSTKLKRLSPISTKRNLHMSAGVSRRRFGQLAAGASLVAFSAIEPTVAKGSKPAFIKEESGISYYDIKTGSGASPVEGDFVIVDYVRFAVLSLSLFTRFVDMH